MEKNLSGTAIPAMATAFSPFLNCILESVSKETISPVA